MHNWSQGDLGLNDSIPNGNGQAPKRSAEKNDEVGFAQSRWNNDVSVSKLKEFQRRNFVKRTQNWAEPTRDSKLVWRKWASMPSDTHVANRQRWHVNWSSVRTNGATPAIFKHIYVSKQASRPADKPVNSDPLAFNPAAILWFSLVTCWDGLLLWIGGFLLFCSLFKC
jgi:hypothetical protein